MLLVLTGDIQIGKTTWLLETVGRLEEAGVGVEGVVAPGVWREVGEGDPAYTASSAPLPEGGREGGPDGPDRPRRRYEKLGIDNLLLPDRTTVPFARREDLARAEGTLDENSQAVRAGLVWCIDDAAIDAVSAHFGRLAEHAAAHGSHAAGPCPDPRLDPRSVPDAHRRVLVVDELGRLELMRGEGLTGAMSLLARGPQGYYDHAVVVARDMFGLNARVEELYADAWGGSARIRPGEAAWQEWFAPLAGR